MDLPKIIEFQKIGDDGVGYLSVAQGLDHVPFEIKRIYWVYNTPENIERGNHAHKESLQIIINITGITTIQLEDTHGKTFDYTLSNPNQGLLIPKMYWRKLRLKKGSICLCISSTEFHEDDYIREYSEFKKY